MKFLWFVFIVLAIAAADDDEDGEKYNYRGCSSQYREEEKLTSEEMQVKSSTDNEEELDEGDDEEKNSDLNFDGFVGETNIETTNIFTDTGSSGGNVQGRTRSSSGTGRNRGSGRFFNRPGGFGNNFGNQGLLSGGFGVHQAYGATSGHGGILPGLQQAFGSIGGNFGSSSGSVAPPSACRYWCRTPQGQAYCCENINQPQSFVGVVKPGQCPPVRPVCPPVRSFSPPSSCSNDGACSGIDKCCFDTCLQQHTCKPPIGIGR